MITECELIEKYLGVPYKHKGRDIEEGLDCWGFLKLCFRDMGFELIDPGIDYPEGWAKRGGNFFIENYHLQWESVNSPNPFDVVLFKNANNVANHAGIILSRARFIHCALKTGVAVCRLNDWKNRIYGFYRLIK